MRTKEEVFAYHPDLAMVPASVMKAVTSATALRELGAIYLNTKFYIDGVIAGGTLTGDLYVKEEEILLSKYTSVENGA